MKKQFLLSILTFTLSIVFTQAQTVNVTFQVDMTGVEVVSTGVYIAGGSVAPDNNSGLALSDADGDDVWTLTTAVPANTEYLFKYRNGAAPSPGDWCCFEEVGPLAAVGCTTGWYNDRFIDVGSVSLVLAVVKFGSCYAVEVSGCTDNAASNYNAAATDDDGACEYISAQCEIPPPFTGNTGVNMTAMLYPSFVQSLPVSDSDAYLVALSESGMVIGSTDVDGENQTSLAIWGDDTFTDEIDGALTGETISFQLVDGSDLYDLELTSLSVNFVPSDSVAFIVNGIAIVEAADVTLATCGLLGCTSDWADNYDELAIQDDGSCIFSGCTNSSFIEYWNYDIVSFEGVDYYYLISPINELVNQDDGSCDTELIYGCVDANFVEYNPAANVFDMTLCQTIIVEGCTDSEAFNFSIIANTDDASCYPVIEGCLDEDAFNYVTPTGDVFIDINTNNDEMCIPVIYGCLDTAAYNYNDYDGDGIANYFTGIDGVDVNTDDGSCIEKVYGCTDNDYVEYNELANTNDGSCQVLFSDAYSELNQNHTSLTESYDQLNSASSLAISELQLILESWNTTIDLVEGWNMFGYGCPEVIDLNSVLDPYTDIQIVKDNNGSIYWPEFGFNGIGDFTPGYGYQIKVTETIEGFSLCDWYVNDIPEDNIVSLQEENAALQAELDSALNAPSIPMYQIGDYAEGGIVFYIDETGQHGLVAALEDLGQFEWGCYGTNLSGADGTSIGTGLQNTMDIVNQGCQTENGGITAAQAALDYESEGYSDWYLPSKDELLEMYNTIGHNGSQGNIGGFSSNYYRSSSEVSSNLAWGVYFSSGNPFYNSKYGPGRVRVIRAF